mmetsp:Transcript_27/g.73  ORF Transcript_27/g.73 Transcript_27/m.73 type:complete len:218 (-) Transcript_27:798-1451(-)
MVPALQQVLFCEVPQLVHVVHDLPPQSEGLGRVLVLPSVIVAQARALQAAGDREAEALLRRLGVEERVEVLQHLVNGVAVEEQERIVVADGIQREQHVVLSEAPPGIAPHQRLPRPLLLLDLRLDLGPGLAVRDDLPRGLLHQRVPQHLHTPLLLKKRVDRLQRAHRVELEQRLHVLQLRVLQKVHELAIVAAHLFRVEDLVPAAHLKHFLEECLVV